jgi:pimeloyl-ACP methyl ester carboxylesterase
LTNFPQELNMRRTVIDPIRHPAAEFSAQMVRVDKGISLHVMQFRPRKNASADPLIFVPGFVSAITGWIDFLREIVPLRPVFYLESREKTSAVIERERLTTDDFSITRLARDLVEACSKLGIDQSRMIVAGSSLGATTLIEALKHSRLQARAGFMIGPNSDFKAPWFIKGLLSLPADAYHLIKFPVLWYLKTFRVDAVKEPEQMQRYQDTLLNANPHRLKKTAKSAVGYTIWQDLETVTVPIAVTLASTDKLHAEQNIQRLTESLPRATIIRCESNKYMHSAAMAGDFERYVASLK